MTREINRSWRIFWGGEVEIGGFLIILADVFWGGGGWGGGDI